MDRIENWSRLTPLLSDIPIGDRAKDALIAMMSGPNRFYHGLDHLTTLWSRHQRYAPGADFDVRSQTLRLACAIAYHDCVHVGGRKDNEEVSARVWLDVSKDSRISEADRGWVAQTIRATSDHLAYTPAIADRFALGDARSQDEASQKATLWMLDLDLTPLGEPAEDFDRNTALLRLEVPHLSDGDYDAARLGFLRRIDQSPVIYRSPALAAVYESVARENIASQLG